MTRDRLLQLSKRSMHATKPRKVYYVPIGSKAMAAWFPGFHPLPQNRGAVQSTYLVINPGPAYTRKISEANGGLIQRDQSQPPRRSIRTGDVEGATLYLNPRVHPTVVMSGKGNYINELWLCYSFSMI